jgi:hypothetical protein
MWARGEPSAVTPQAAPPQEAAAEILAGCGRHQSHSTGWLLTASFVSFFPLRRSPTLTVDCSCIDAAWRSNCCTVGRFAQLPFNIYSFMTTCALLGIGFGPHVCLQTTIWNEALPTRLMNVTTDVLGIFNEWKWS